MEKIIKTASIIDHPTATKIRTFFFLKQHESSYMFCWYKEDGSFLEGGVGGQTQEEAIKNFKIAYGNPANRLEII